MNSMLAAIKRNCVNRRCTLDGKPAKIAGGGLDVALVAPLNPEFRPVQMSWYKVGTVMRDYNGEFRSDR